MLKNCWNCAHDRNDRGMHFCTPIDDGHLGATEWSNANCSEKAGNMPLENADGCPGFAPMPDTAPAIDPAVLQVLRLASIMKRSKNTNRRFDASRDLNAALDALPPEVRALLDEDDSE